MPAKRPKQRRPAKRNPVAKAVKKLRPQIIPNRRRKKLEQTEKREVVEEEDEKDCG